MATVTRVTSGGLLELSATAGCRSRVEGRGGATGSHEGPAPLQGLMGAGCGVFFLLFFCSSRGRGACAGACPSPICCRMLTRDTTNGTSAKPQELFQLTAFSSRQLWGDGLRRVGGRMETSGHVDGSGWIEMGHDQLCPNELDLAGQTDEKNISEMIQSSDLLVLLLPPFSVF